MPLKEMLKEIKRSIWLGEEIDDLSLELAKFKVQTRLMSFLV